MKIEIKRRKRKVNPQKRHPDSSFWEGKTVEELAKEQGVKPLDDISRISGGWEDVDVDEFLKVVRGT